MIVHQHPAPQPLEDKIIYDLTLKMSDDIEATMRRVIDIAPAPWMPLLVQAGVTALAAIVGEMKNDELIGRLNEENLKMLAALMVGRAAIEGELHAGFSEAKKDMEALFKQQRVR
ncbi:hypothetical protein CQ14_06555 [Bradyrhizobium lablabi]|uniref:Uncharacterized protein n=1 Tax=Bradyrhizobium lablabi TaxID=722472 RepID=A0A0R3MLY2_9BRAD|nr:hypothetical protein [Bradyrhizobium lablabi]KRR21304.1 hypothetical protein CQ14_06555 [Bradyrhizobium lablabi]